MTESYYIIFFKGLVGKTQGYILLQHSSLCQL